MKKKKAKKTGKKGGLLAGTGIVIIAGLLIGFDPFGWGMGLGEGKEAGNNVQNENQNDDKPDNQEASGTPEPTVAPTEPAGDNTQEVVLTEVAVTVQGSKLIYNGAEAESAQKLAEQIAADYAQKLESVVVVISDDDAVYNTVEELKLALEAVDITYEVKE